MHTSGPAMQNRLSVCNGQHNNVYMQHNYVNMQDNIVYIRLKFITFLHVEIDMWHGMIIILHIDIIYLACRGISMPRYLCLIFTQTCPVPAT